MKFLANEHSVLQLDLFLASCIWLNKGKMARKLILTVLNLTSQTSRAHESSCALGKFRKVITDFSGVNYA